jgi:electron transfer flavoprotein alpha subunit
MDMNKYRHILVYAEVKGDRIAENSLELMGEACVLKEKLGNDTLVFAAVLGKQTSPFINELYTYGADTVITFDDEKLAQYRSDIYGEALTAIIEKYRPEIVLVGCTCQGAELAPTVAAKLKTGLAAHCTELKVDQSGQFIQVVPAFGGKVLGDILTPKHRPQMATVKAGICRKREHPGKTGNHEVFTCALHGFGDKIIVLALHHEKAKGKPLHEADCIIGGGFGVGNKENWALLEELASLVNGATGCTRPALDEGWTDGGEHTMIGTSGVAVRPKVYINCGVSGAAHHTCGIKDAGVVISINTNANAEIFKHSDIKIVSDWKKIIPLVIEKLKK